MKLIPLFLILLLAIPILPISASTDFLTGTFNPVVVPPSDWNAYWYNVTSNIIWGLEYNDGSGWVVSKLDFKVVYSSPNYYSRKYAIEFTADKDGDYRYTMEFKDKLIQILSTKSTSTVLKFEKDDKSTWAIEFDYSDVASISDVSTKSEPIADKYKFTATKPTIKKGEFVSLDPLFEYNSGAQVDQFSYYGTTYISQTFTVGAFPHTVNLISASLATWAEDGSVYFDIYAVDANHKPTGASLSSGSITCANIDNTAPPTTTAWENVTMTEYNLAANTEYAIVSYSDSSTYAIWGITGDDYASGVSWVSTDSGSTWATGGDWDCLFKIYGSGEVLVTSTYKSIISETVSGSATSTVTLGTSIVSTTITGGTSTITTGVTTLTHVNGTTIVNSISVYVTTTVSKLISVTDPAGGTLTEYATFTSTEYNTTETVNATLTSTVTTVTYCNVATSTAVSYSTSCSGTQTLITSYSTTSLTEPTTIYCTGTLTSTELTTTTSTSGIFMLDFWEDVTADGFVTVPWANRAYNVGQGYGVVSGAFGGGADRGLGSGGPLNDALQRGFFYHTGGDAVEWQFDLPDGDYTFTIWIGDIGWYGHAELFLNGVSQGIISDEDEPHYFKYDFGPITVDDTLNVTMDFHSQVAVSGMEVHAVVESPVSTTTIVTYDTTSALRPTTISATSTITTGDLTTITASSCETYLYNTGSKGGDNFPIMVILSMIVLVVAIVIIQKRRKG